MPKLADPDPTQLAVPSSLNDVPSSRLKNAYQAWRICKDTEDADKKRADKRTRLFRAYHRFPPSDYSTLFKQGMGWQSNVGFGMMAYVVDNNLSSFFDMVTERVMAADIKTKFGNERDRAEYSDKISLGFDKVLREWDDFLLNVEQDLLDMLLFSKGIEMWSDKEGCTTEHVSADDFLVPDGTKVGFSNFDYCVVKKKFGLHEIWEAIESAGEQAESMGWNTKAVFNAMRLQRQEWAKEYKTGEDFSKAAASGDITFASNLKETLDCYMLFIREFKKKTISKFVVLRNYGPMLSLTRDVSGKEPNDKDFIKAEGFLFKDLDHAECIDDIFSVFMDCAGSKFWHQITSLAEKIFVQCRQYDFAMNAIMDAVKVNMSLMLQAQTAEASDKIKAMVFGPYTIIPADVPFVQQRLQLDTTSATNTLQFMMLDMFRGIGEYRINDRAGGGQAVTATQNQNDTAEAAKLSGTQLKRYNGQHSQYYRKFLKRLLSLKSGEKDYEMKEKFVTFMEEHGVPKEAYDWKNIESVKSNMLAGAGSPSYKLMASEKTIKLTNISPASEGQANAIKDALAALHGRENVDRYFKSVRPEPTFNEQKAGWENEMLGNPLSNPADVRVMPDDNDVHHLAAHLGDMERVISLVNENMQKGTISDSVAETAAFRLLNIGGHSMAHIEKLKRDEDKQEVVKQAVSRLQAVQRGADKLAQDMQAMKEKRTAEFDPTKDPDIAKKVAMNQIEINHAEKMSGIKAAAVAQSHQQRAMIQEDKAANEIAINRAKEVDKIQTKNKLEKKSAAKKKPNESE